MFEPPHSFPEYYERIFLHFFFLKLKKKQRKKHDHRISMSVITILLFYRRYKGKKIAFCYFLCNGSV